VLARLGLRWSGGFLRLGFVLGSDLGFQLTRNTHIHFELINFPEALFA
jgi:hypothetical protein